MKHLKNFVLFETMEAGNQISIDQFLSLIGLPPHLHPRISEWWKSNRNNIEIHYFHFETKEPIAGVFLSEDIIAVNSNTHLPPHIRLFLALHESRHCDQHRDGIFMEGYFDTVARGDKEGFLTAYRELEDDANTFAIDGMREMGFGPQMAVEAHRLRANENAGEKVFEMMSRDIQKFGAGDMFDLLRAQIGIDR